MSLNPSSGQRVLFIPAVAIGNIGQIAIDKLRRVLKVNPAFTPSPSLEYLDSRGYLIPCAGRDYQGTITTPLEIHHLSPFLSVLQIRSCVVPGRSNEFVKYLVELAKEHNFNHLVVLGGASALALTQEGDFLETRTVPRFCTSVTKVQETTSGFQFMPWEDVFKLKFAGLLPFFVDFKNRSEDRFSLELSALVLFVFEGENQVEGEAMALHSLKFLSCLA